MRKRRGGGGWGCHSLLSGLLSRHQRYRYHENGHASRTRWKTCDPNNNELKFNSLTRSISQTRQRSQPPAGRREITRLQRTGRPGRLFWGDGRADWPRAWQAKLTCRKLGLPLERRLSRQVPLKRLRGPLFSILPHAFLSIQTHNRSLFLCPFPSFVYHTQHRLRSFSCVDGAESASSCHSFHILKPTYFGDGEQTANIKRIL